MKVLLFFTAHWYLSLFFQTFFHHRYASHNMFNMSKFWERVFFIFTWIAQGTSYLNPYSYAYMHRLHHANADQEHDPHSPKYSKNIFTFMLKTWKKFETIKNNKANVNPLFSKNLPRWERFEPISESWLSRLFWVFFYVAAYVYLDASTWMYFLLLPIHFIMGPVHGAIINWFSHKFGYRNFKQSNNSTNLFPIEILMMGEGLHNNHHYDSKKANFAKKWFEFDPSWPLIKLMHALKLIQLNPKALA